MTYRSGPACAAKPRKRRLPIIAPHCVVIAQRHARLKIGHAPDRAEIIIAAEARAGRAAQETAKHALLRRHGIQPRKLIPPSCSAPYKQGRDVEHQGLSTVTRGNSRATLSGLTGIL